MKHAFALLFAALLIVACSPQEANVSEVAPEDAREAAEQTSSQAGIVRQETKQQSFEMEVGDWFFSPEQIVVEEGTEVTVRIRNVGERAHGFGLSEFNVREYIAPGEERTITFVADRKGTYRIFCSVPCGSGHQSMSSVLIVE